MANLSKVLLFVAGMTCFNLPLHADGQALPADIEDFLQRAEGCLHFAGEEPYDAERAAQISAAVTELDCEQLPHDTDVLMHRYQQQPQWQKMITEAMSWW